MSEQFETTAELGIQCRHEDALAIVQIALAHPRNSFRPEHVEALSATLSAAVEAGARAVLLHGSDVAFSAGWDLAAIQPGESDPTAVLSAVVGPLLRQVRHLPVPTVAAVRGPALGFGFGLALCCDLVVAADDALLGSPFRRLGMVPDSGTHHILLNRLGFAWASELIYTGRLLSGAEAANLRLINRAVPPEHVLDEALILARDIAQGPTQAFIGSKRILLQGGDFQTMFEHETHELQRVFGSADVREGLAAFMQRRSPDFAGR